MLAQAIARYASGAQWAQDQGVRNAYVLKRVGDWVVPKALFSGMWVRWVPGATNDDDVTANVFDLGVKPVLDWNGAELGQGAIAQDRPTEMYFSASSDAWILAPWADARNVSGDGTTDPGGDPSEDTQLVAMGGDTIYNVSSVSLDPAALGAQDGDLMVVVTQIGALDNEPSLNDTSIPSGWSEHLRDMLSVLSQPSFEMVVASEVFSGTPPSNVDWSFPTDMECSYAWFIVRNATVVDTPTVFESTEDSPGLVEFFVTNPVSQEIILVAALSNPLVLDGFAEETATLSGLQQSGRDTSPSQFMMSLFGTTTAEGSSRVSYTTNSLGRYSCKNVWIPISKA
ncbi:MAG: hypothetical protein ACOC9Q_03550 [bacterium]